MGKSRVGLTRRMIRRVLFAPAVFMPAVMGGLMAYMGRVGPIAMFGAGLIIVSLFVAASKWTLGRKELTTAALNDVLRQQRRENLNQLDALRSQLRRDRDPRSSDQLARLRSVFERTWDLTPDPVDEWQHTPEVFEHLTELYQSCLKLLERTFELWKASRTVTTDRARHQLLDSRDELLHQVDESIERLDASLDSLQTASVDRTHEELFEQNSQLQKELEKSLSVSRAVEKRMDELQRELRVSEGS